MTMKELVLKNRSYRRFHQSESVSIETLKELVDLARLSATGGNMQPLKFIVSNDASRNDLIFPQLGWAAYLKDWAGPGDGERPSAYIIILGDTRIKTSFGCDHGIVAQSMLLGAVEKGLGGCIIATIQKPALSQALAIPNHFEVLLVIALGKPKEAVVIEPIGPSGDIKYWRDAQGVHHVPKRSLDELIVG
jgi:nitroreductase